MAQLSEVPRGYAYIAAKCAGLAPGGVHKGVAPEGTPTPYIVMSHIGGPDVGGAGGPRLWNNGNFQVLVCGPDEAQDAPYNSAYADVVSVADAVDTALEYTSGNAGGATIMRSRRMEPIEYGEIVNGAQWSRLGARWNVLIRKTG